MRQLKLAASIVLCAAASAQAVNARLALDATIPSIKLDAVSLKDAVDFVQDVSAANVHVNWGALEAAGIGKDALVSLNLRSVPLRKALDLILSDAAAGNTALTYTIDDNVIDITTRELADKVLVTRVYPVGDLLMDVPDFVGPTFDISSSSNSSSVTPGGGGSGGGGSGGGGSGGGSLFGGGGGSTAAENTPSKDQRAQQLIDLITTIVRPDIWAANGGPATIRFFNNSLVITAPRSVQEAIDGPVD